jgi:hypothetical protein
MMQACPLGSANDIWNTSAIAITGTGMAKRTYLDTSDGMAKYAETHGAERDFQGRWYVDGDVPHELMGLIPKKPNTTFHEVAPMCPMCGAHTTKKFRKSDGQPFWGCSQYSEAGCKGVVDYDDYWDALDDPGRAKTAFEALCTPQNSNGSTQSKKQSEVPNELAAYIDRLDTLATKQRGSYAAGRKWFQTPKFTLKGKTPIEIMTSIEGCQLVEELLLKVND